MSVTRTLLILLHQQLTVFFCYRQVALKQLPPQEEAAANQLTRFGYLVTEPSEADKNVYLVTFVSKLHMEYTRFCFCSHSYNILAHMPASMSDFLRLALQQMSFSQMDNPLTVSNTSSRGPLEAYYRNEFYR